jgi:hypothetical protein
MPATALKPKILPDIERQQILDKLGDLSHITIAQNEFLMAVYVRSNRSPGGLYLTDKTVKEDVYQGKVGLVVKIGDACRFERVDPKTNVVYGVPVKLYDWVVVKPSDTWALDVNADPEAMKREDFVTCRLAYDDMVRMVIDTPNMVW